MRNFETMRRLALLDDPPPFGRAGITRWTDGTLQRVPQLARLAIPEWVARLVVVRSESALRGN